MNCFFGIRAHRSAATVHSLQQRRRSPSTSVGNVYSVFFSDTVHIPFAEWIYANFYFIF